MSLDFNFSTLRERLHSSFIDAFPGRDELIFGLADKPIKAPQSPNKAYAIVPYSSFMDSEIIGLLASCGFHFKQRQFQRALELCIPNGVHLIASSSSGVIVGMMMSRHLSTSRFPFGGRIDWLATHPLHRGRGLGRWCAFLATNHLLQRGYTNIWVTTQPTRPHAISIFTSLGFRQIR